jgi:hypothetical protein
MKGADCFAVPDKVWKCGRVLFPIVEFRTCKRLSRFPCEICTFEDRGEFDGFIAFWRTFRNDAHACHPTIGYVIVDTHVSVVCLA